MPKGYPLKIKRYFLCGLILWLATFPFVTAVLAASEHHGQVKFGGLPIPGVTVTASQGDKKLVTISDDQGMYSFPDLADGVWTIEIEMLCFVPIKQDVTIGSDAAIPDWELKLLPLDEIRAQAGPSIAPPVSLSVNAPAATPAPESADAAKPAKKSKKTAPAAANTPGGFQRADVNASKSDAATQSNANAAAAAGDNATGSDDLSKKAADGLLINGTANNGASSPFATNPAFGNNRIGMRSLYNGSIGFRLDNSALDARTFSITGQDTPKPETNNFTGIAVFGGPLKIPHVVMNSPIFVTVNYQWTRNRVATATAGLMPTAAQRSGDFSQLGTTITDPTTMLAFPGNVIPQTRISPQALSLLNLYPLPNFTGKYNYQLPLVAPTHQDIMNSRVNKTINRKNQIFGTLTFQSTRLSTPSLLDLLSSTDSLGQNESAGWRHTFTNRFWTTLGYTFSRLSTTLTPNFANKENISGEAGIMGNNQQPQNWGPPNLSFSSGINPLSYTPQSVTHTQTGAVSDINYWNHGRHNVQFGADFKKQQFNTIGQQNPRGTFTFNGTSTGDDFAGFLLGIPDTSSIAYGNADKYLRATIYDGFVQDDVRISPSLTIQAGLRWDYSSPPTELYGRLVNLDVVPGFSAAAPVIANSPVGPLTGDKYPASLIQPDKHEFEPIIGLAWRPFPASSMVIRANYGLLYNTAPYQQLAPLMDQQSPLSKSFSVQNSVSDPLTLANGFTASPTSTMTGYGIDPNFRVGYAQNWGASVQRDLPGALLMTVSYAGIKGTRATQEFYPNTYPIGAVNPCSTCLPGYIYITSNGNSTREAGQVQLRRRLHNGITASVLYVYSKSIDDASLGGKGQSLFAAQNWLDLSGDRGLSPFDQRHQVTVTGQYTSGMGMRGGTLLSGWRGVLFKEWTVNGTLIVGTGLPLTPNYLATVPGTGFTGFRGDYTGAPIYDAPSGLFLNPAAFTGPASGQWGTAGRDSITGPSQFSLNASLGRVFRLSDRLNLEIRVDSTNALNHVTFGSWVTTINSPQFGAPPSSANAMRSMLTTVRLRF
jgi:trimeric autotransporter adhesin